ncbi:carbohydrate kinase family protein [Amycolatopsis acidiphila]|uniref:Carbohydrate kinase family protein n=1 Tax=Amycolatopsis acidiphila TaxID=715473 RepID=A0A558AN25_9PSEU|nr:carbohydrate kinase family protein [Amycolatopsis acidiphila]TVT25645.1 carbohydrate kinase family protein [Amycolatopsis acidiphila]UIJ60401.1 carbohydrate kinase family protein [Amycolatopsis acidiphila]GHG90394.1 kinase [Amycolatopsis acidiphila]
MRIAVTGSIATDHLMVFPGRFTEQLVADRLDKVSLSFLVDQLDVRRGGVAANISFGLGVLGLSPILVGAVGADFADYRSWLERHGVDTKSVRVSETRHTSRFLCTTDEDQNQIASFYAGAMEEAREIRLAPVADRAGGLDLVLIAPNDPVAMVRHTEECRQRGFAFAADPSQQLARMGGPEVRKLVDGASYLFTNEYETALLLKSTGWSAEDVRDRVRWWVQTQGADGVRIEGCGVSLTVPAVPVKQEADPTGIGDAFRAGFLWGRHARLSLERSAQAGCTLAAIALETVGTQEYRLTRQSFSDRVARAYGSAAAADIEAKLRI